MFFPAVTLTAAGRERRLPPLGLVALGGPGKGWLEQAGCSEASEGARVMAGRREEGRHSIEKGGGETFDGGGRSHLIIPDAALYMLGMTLKLQGHPKHVQSSIRND